MADFDEKLNSLLSNPDAMSQIMQLAQSLSGGDTPPSPPPKQSEPAQPPSQPASGSDLLSAFTGGVDPSLLMKLLPLVQELGSTRESNARQLLYALRPYLKSDKQEKVERALQLARLYHIGKKVLAEWEG